MFKWLKKVMISIINAIKSLFVGNKPVQSVTIGDTQVYPNGIVTYQMSGSPTLEYSSGQNYILASGDGYARIVGTLITLVDGVEQSRETVEFSPTLLTSGVDNIWSVSNKHIFAADREDVTGDVRSASFQAMYSNSEGFTYNGGMFTVNQQANSSSTSAGAITDFKLNGQNTIISVDDQAQTLYVNNNLAGYRNVTYTSEFPGRVSIPSTSFNFTISGGEGWTTLNNNGVNTTIVLTANNSGSTREAVVTVKDGSYPSAQASIRIKQAVPWVLSVPGQVYIAYDATSFSFNVTSTNNGVAAPINSSMVSVVTNNSNLSLTGIEAVSGSTGVYKISFSCSVNTDTSNTKTSEVRITRSDHTESPRIVSIVQAANSSAFEYINSQHVSSNNPHWILGTVTTGRTEHYGVNGQNVDNTGIIIACDSPITSDKTIRISSITVQRRDPSSQGLPTRKYTANSVVQTITAGTELEVSFDFTNVGGDSYTKTYYGAWLRISGVTWSPPNWNESSGSITIFSDTPPTTEIWEVGTITVS